MDAAIGDQLNGSLSPEQWERVLNDEMVNIGDPSNQYHDRILIGGPGPGAPVLIAGQFTPVGGIIPHFSKQSLAALLLLGEEGGFSWDDYDELERAGLILGQCLSDMCHFQQTKHAGEMGLPAAIDAVNAMQAKIAKLLPPRDLWNAKVAEWAEWGEDEVSDTEDCRATGP